MDSNFIKQAIINYCKGFNDWIIIPELRMGIGFKGNVFAKLRSRNDPDCERRIDLFAMSLNKQSNYLRIAFEIKTSIGDFYRELADRIKRRAAVRFSNYYYIVTPKGLITPKQIPDDAGLIEIDDDGTLLFSISAPLHDNIPSWGFVASLLRTVKKMEADDGR